VDYVVPVLIILLISNLVQSTFSFGGALVALPLLVLFIDARFATALLTIMSFTISVSVVYKSWRSIDLKSASKLIISSFVSIPIGVYFLVTMNEVIIKGMLALTIVLFSALNLLSVRENKSIKPYYVYGFGFISGLFGGAYGMSGPAVVLFGSLSGWNSDQFRSTIQSYSLMTNAFAIASHFIAGNFTKEVVMLYFYAIPILLLSIWIGGYIHKKIPSENYKKYVNYLLFALGANLMLTIVR